MGSEQEKLSRFSRRNLGVTNRIWLIVALFICLILLTHYVLPAHTSAFSQPTYSNANLKAKNYLKLDKENPQLSNPFDFCPAHGPMDQVGNKYGAVRLGQSRLHVGSGARVQRVLNSALAGYPVTISVLGGSGTCSIQTGAIIAYMSQFLLVTVRETIQYHRHVTHRGFSNGGIASSRTQPPS